MKRLFSLSLLLVGASLALSQVHTSPAPDRDECTYCRGLGIVNCQACLGSNGLPTGLAICSTCNGNGTVKCSKCNGNWKTSCSACAGTGSVLVGYSGGFVRQPVFQTCTACNGKGNTFLCDGCKEGRVPCDACQGRGRVGPCPQCQGQKKTTCPRCQGEKLVKAASEIPLASASPSPTSRPDNPGSAAPIGPLDPLVSLDDLVAHLKRGQPVSPQREAAKWNQMTTLQQDEALRTYREDLAHWQDRNREYEGRKVNWSVVLVDVTAATDGSYKVQTASAGGFPMTWIAPAAAKDQLLKLKKKDLLQVTGTIKVSRFNESSTGGTSDAGRTNLEVELKEASIVTPAAGSIKLDASSQPSQVYVSPGK